MQKLDSEGFTLIEVLIAMIVLAVGLLALEGLAIAAARMVAQADRRSEHVEMATQSVETALAQLRCEQAPAELDEVQEAGERLVRTVDYANPRAPVVTVQVIPADNGFAMPSDTLTVSSTLFLPAGGTGGC